MDLTNKVALVTGGAVGIGKEIVKALAKAKARVIINYNKSVNEANILKSSLQEEGLDVEIIQANIASFKESQNLVDEIITKYQTIDILVNNAGITKDNLIVRMSEEEFDLVLDTNLKGAWNCSKHVAKYMTKQRSGKIINITSVVALHGNIGQSNYCSAKAGLIGLTKALARELAKRNICVNAVAPGFIETKMTENLPSNLVEEVIKSIPLNRSGKADEVASLVLFLASNLSDYITGQVINVDGGMGM